MKIFFLLLILCCNLYSLNAQMSIRGRVVNREHESIAYATIRLLQLDSTMIAGTTTDTTGYYQLIDIQKGDYILTLSCIGYKSAASKIPISKENIEVPLHILESDNVILGEVKITGSSIIRKKDRTLILPDKKQIKHSLTGYDLLYNLMIPDINVNRNTGKITTVLGEATLYIDGEKAEYRDVQSLRSRDVEKIEYFSMPIGKYLGDKSSINYITKKHKSGGYISLDGKQNIGYLKGDYNAIFKITNNNTSYAIRGGYNNKHYNGVQINKNENILFPEYIINRNSQTEDTKIKSNQQYAQFKVNNSTNKYSISGLLSFIQNNNPQNETSKTLNYSVFYTEKKLSLNKIKQQGLKPSLDLYSTFYLPKKQILDISINAIYTKNKYERDYHEDSDYSSTNVNEDLYSINTNIKYNIGLKHNNSFGVDGRHYQNITSSSYIGDYNSWQHLWMGESILSLNYAQQVCENINITISPGASCINYKLHSENLKRYWSFQMKSQISFSINNQQQLMCAIDIGNNHPDISYVNNVDQTIDFLQIQRGNPRLKNTKIYNGALIYSGSFGRLNLLSAFLYDIYQNNISTDFYIENQKLINSFRSDGNAYKMSTQLVATYRISDNLRTKLAVKYDNTRTIGIYKFKKNAIASTLDLNYFYKDFSANIFTRSPMKSLDSYSLITRKTPFTYGGSIGWNQKGWVVEIGTENPFTRNSQYKEYRDLKVYKYNQEQTSRIYQQTAYIKLAYTFDFGKKTSHEENNVDKNIKSAILKTD